MACEGSNKLHACRGRSEDAHYFKLMESRREDTRDPDDPLSEYPTYRRWCGNCESKKRTAEFALGAAYERDAAPDCPGPKRVQKDLQTNRKGSFWVAKGSAIAQAKAEIKNEREGGVVPRSAGRAQARR